MEQATKVTIQRIGNVLTVDPPMTDLLHPLLSYAHRQRNTDWQSGKCGSMTFERKLLYRIKDGKLLTTQGALARITEYFTKVRIPWEFTDTRRTQKLEPDWDHLQRCMPHLEFRLKQDEVLAHIIGCNNGIIVAPTAYGKTFIMLALVALYPKANIIIASPGVQLLDSTYRRILQIVGSDVGRVGGGVSSDPRRVTLSTFHSLMGAPVEKCDILLVDECHRAAAKSFAASIAHVRNAVKIFGMTATPEGRGDGAELVSEVLLGPKIYEIKYQEAADAGIVSNIVVVSAPLNSGTCEPVSLKYSQTVARRRHGYWRNEIRNKLFARAMSVVPKQFGIADDAQRLVLTKTLEHALRLKKLMPDYRIVYGTLDKKKREMWIGMGLLPKDYKPLTAGEKRQMLRDFEDGKLRKVIATGCWGEGVDFVYLQVVANAAGEGSSIDATQWAGRNSRLGDDSKSFGLLIDCNDKWDQWARNRALLRFRTYRKHGWKIVETKSIDEIPIEERAKAGGGAVSKTSPDPVGVDG